jgi:cell division protease FtsH
MTKDDLFEQIVGLLGGRTAEELVFGVQSTGASNDFEQATGLARSMVTEYGMSDKLGPVQYEGNHQVFVGRDYGQTKAYSEQVAYEIDLEVRAILEKAHAKARSIIEEYHETHKLIAEKLLEFETLDAKQINSLFKEGRMPAGQEEFPSEKQNAQTFEEAKRALEARDAEKQTSEIADDAANQTSETTATPDEPTDSNNDPQV